MLLIVCRLIMCTDITLVDYKSQTMIYQILKAFGQVVKEHRKRMGLSQEAFADLCELHRTYLSGVERGLRNISFENLEHIACALNIPLSELIKEAEDLA